jgi:hypothetical protein
MWVWLGPTRLPLDNVSSPSMSPVIGLEGEGVEPDIKRDGSEVML